jgi:hypothetical protein
LHSLRATDADAKEADALSKLSRYEKSLERSLFRTLEELRRLQDRRSRPAPPIWMSPRWSEEILNDESLHDLR